ncbi:MAG: hypothetical protein AAGU11_19210 [Syntrophobacteraceae bacterium]
MFRCILCRHDCYAVRGRPEDEEINPAFEVLRNSGKYKEHFVMKRRENAEIKNQLSFLERSEAKEEKKEDMENLKKSGATDQNGGQKDVFLLEEGKIKVFSAEEYTASTLYQAVESFSVECRLVRPEEPGNMVFEGKKPSKKTVPILVKKDGECVILASWEELESQPSQLADAVDVVGAMPVKQVFVLKRK